MSKTGNKQPLSLWTYSKLSSLSFCGLVIGLVCFFFSNTLYAQDAQTSLTKARDYYRNDQMDSASVAYKDALTNGDPDTQLYALSGLAKIAISQSRMKEADSLIELGLKLQKEADISLTAQCSFGTLQGNFLKNASRLSEALKVHKAVISRSLLIEDDRLPYAEALFNTALIFERIGQYDSGVYYIQLAYPLYKEIMDSTDIRLSSIYNGMGVCFYRAGKFEESENFYLKAKAIAEQTQGPISSDLALCLSNLASIYREKKDFHKAIEVTEEAQRIFTFLKDEGNLSGTYYGLGVYHYYLGDYGKTRSYMRACIGIRERLFGKDHYTLIGPYEVLGITYEEAGKYPETLRMLDKARKNILANYGPRSLSIAYNSENRAVVLKVTGQLDSALKYIEDAYRILPDHLSPNDESLATNYYNYADILYFLNDFEKAGFMLQKSMEVLEIKGLQNSEEYRQAMALRASIKAGQGQWKAATKEFRKVLEKENLKSASSSFNESSLNPTTLSILNDYCSFLFHKYKALNDVQILDELNTYSQKYLDLAEKFRLRHNDPYTKSILIKRNSKSQKQKIGIYNSLYQDTKSEEFLNQVYLFSEHSKTSMLRDMQNEKIKSFAGLPDSLLAKEIKLKKKISSLIEKQYQNIDSLTVVRELLKVQKELDNHVDLMSSEYPRYHNLRFATQVPSIDNIRSKLASGENLLQFMHDDTAYYVLMLRPEKLALNYLGNKEKIDKAIEKWRLAMTGRGDVHSDSFLYKCLWGNIKEGINGNRIVIVPSGKLFYFNFELLQENGRYLLEDYNISYSLSSSVYFSESQGVKKANLLAIAPGFEDELKEKYLDGLDSLNLPDEAYLHTLRQPWSLNYVQEIDKRYANLNLAGLNATESRVKQSLPKGNLIYFGTHAIADAQDPLRSRFVLAKESGNQSEDGYLHAYEMYGIKLDAEMAILSACESGLGQLQEGEGMISLAYSINYAGCPSTVMSLWKVDEKVNTEISERLLTNLAKGMPKSEAIREAKLAYLHDNPGTHPFYWGGMVLMGKDGTIEVKQKNLYQKYLIPTAILLFLILIFALIPRNLLPSN
ncbi:MAG: CHAT domain-containing protein [Bacteroidia bacterium]|nr:CHAT domain-containing protein [Bacteroidia bacterium]